MNDKDIEKILDLADKYAHECQLILSSDHTSEDDVNRARRELRNEIVSLVAQYKEDAEKWRAYVEQKNEVINAGMGRNPFRKEEG